MIKSAVVVIAVLFVSSFAKAQDITINTGKAGSRITVNNSGNTRETQTDHLLGVGGQIHFFQPPKGAFQVQCFFIARSEFTKTEYVFDIEQVEREGGFSDFSFESPPITGTTQQWTTIPYGGGVSGTVNDMDGNKAGTFTGNYGGTITQGSAVLGSKFVGWIVRIVVNGHVTRVASNQPFLSDMANQQEKFFDALIAKQKETK